MSAQLAKVSRAAMKAKARVLSGVSDTQPFSSAAKPVFKPRLARKAGGVVEMGVAGAKADVRADRKPRVKKEDGGSLGRRLWLSLPPNLRRNITPEQLEADANTARGFAGATGPLGRLAARVLRGKPPTAPPAVLPAAPTAPTVAPTATPTPAAPRSGQAFANYSNPTATPSASRVALAAPPAPTAPAAPPVVPTVAPNAPRAAPTAPAAPPVAPKAAPTAPRTAVSAWSRGKDFALGVLGGAGAATYMTPGHPSEPAQPGTNVTSARVTPGPVRPNSAVTAPSRSGRPDGGDDTGFGAYVNPALAALSPRANSAAEPPPPPPSRARPPAMLGPGTTSADRLNAISLGISHSREPDFDETPQNAAEMQAQRNIAARNAQNVAEMQAQRNIAVRRIPTLDPHYPSDTPLGNQKRGGRIKSMLKDRKSKPGKPRR